MGVPFNAAEVAAIKAFVKESTRGTGLGIPGARGKLGMISGEWEALGVAEGFATTQTAAVLAEKNKKLRLEAGIMVNARWPNADEKAVLAFVKEQTGIEFGELGDRNPAWKDLESEWPGKGFSTERTAKVLGQRCNTLMQKAGRT